MLNFLFKKNIYINTWSKKDSHDVLRSIFEFEFYIYLTKNRKFYKEKKLASYA
jgi:hypothetical protein